MSPLLEHTICVHRLECLDESKNQSFPLHMSSCFGDCPAHTQIKTVCLLLFSSEFLCRSRKVLVDLEGIRLGVSSCLKRTQNIIDLRPREDNISQEMAAREQVNVLAIHSLLF